MRVPTGRFPGITGAGGGAILIYQGDVDGPKGSLPLWGRWISPENACIVPGKTDEVLVAGSTPFSAKAQVAMSGDLIRLLDASPDLRPRRRLPISCAVREAVRARFLISCAVREAVRARFLLMGKAFGDHISPPNQILFIPILNISASRASRSLRRPLLTA